MFWLWTPIVKKHHACPHNHGHTNKHMQAIIYVHLYNPKQIFVFNRFISPQAKRNRVFSTRLLKKTYSFSSDVRALDCFTKKKSPLLYQPLHIHVCFTVNYLWIRFKYSILVRHLLWPQFETVFPTASRRDLKKLEWFKLQIGLFEMHMHNYLKHLWRFQLLFSTLQYDERGKSEGLREGGDVHCGRLDYYFNDNDDNFVNWNKWTFYVFLSVRLWWDSERPFTSNVWIILYLTHLKITIVSTVVYRFEILFMGTGRCP